MASVVAALLSLSIAPSFDSFLESSLGRWSGASYKWTPSEWPQTTPLLKVPGYVTRASPSSTFVAEVMRSCGGAVQGVDELREGLVSSKVFLNRGVDGTTFFSFGSWAAAPTTVTAEGFVIGVNLAHADRTRSRILVRLSEGRIESCDVSIEGHETNVDRPSAAQALLDGRTLPAVVEANSWEGRASTLTLDGTPPAGTPWLNARISWKQNTALIDGNLPLVPSPSPGSSVAYLPGGCWAASREDASSGLLDVEVGSLALEASEMKSIIHSFEHGKLQRVRFSKLVRHQN